MRHAATSLRSATPLHIQVWTALSAIGPHCLCWWARHPYGWASTNGLTLLGSDSIGKKQRPDPTWYLAPLLLGSAGNQSPRRSALEPLRTAAVMSSSGREAVSQ